MNPFFGKSLVDFISQPGNAGFDHVGHGVEMVVPDMLHDHGLGDYPVGVAHEVLQERKLERLQFDSLPGPHDLAGHQVHGDITGDQTGGFGGPAGPAQQGLHPGQKFGKGKRFGQVVVTAGLKAPNPVFGGAFGAQDDHRGC